MDGKDDGTISAASTISRINATTAGDSEDSEGVWGVKLLPVNGIYTYSVSNLFIAHQFNKRDAIFKLGELCPLTALYGIPIIIFSPRIQLKRHDPNDMEENQPAVYLRIESDNGFAPVQ